MRLIFCSSSAVSCQFTVSVSKAKDETARGGGGVNLVKQEGQGLQEVSPGWKSLALIRGEHQGLVGGQNASQSHIQAYRHNMPP